MKKLFAVIMTLVMLLGCVSLTAFAEEQPLTANVYVTIANKGNLVVTQEKITVTDKDSSGTLTIDEALYAAHEAKYEGGAEAGYNSYIDDEYGLSLGKLWGDNSGNFGYYVNNASAWSLADTVNEGDCLNAFIYSDGVYYSDTYCWFDITSASADVNEEITLKLSGAGYDANWNPVTVAVEGAIITVNGEKTEYKTDAEGRVTIKIADGGNCVISAVSDTQTLVPPVCLATIATNDTAKVYVTISDKDGKLVLTQEEITVYDSDKDGYLTVNDALYCAHEEKYEGGAEAGYASYYGDYGLSLNKLWGTANGGSYGYYVNNASAQSLADTVKTGDYVNAFVYTDLTAWSDTYCYFNVNTTAAEAGKEISLVLSAAGYDNDYNPIVLPVEGATITLNGERTSFKTDKDGKVTFTVDKEGSYIISAVSDTQVLVPPVCKATVSAATVTLPDNNTSDKDASDTDLTSPKTGDNSNIILFVALMVVSIGALVTLSVTRKKSYEE